MLISYNWLKSYVPEIPDVDKLSELITFHMCEIESVLKKDNGDYVFDLKVLPDRAHDLLSHQGVAREISSLLGIDFKIKEYNLPKDFSDTKLQINIDDSNCNRYIGRIIRGVKVGPSPEWMVSYLESIGQRSINNIVDATNIVMFDCGQPIHAFDLSKLSKEEIIVKNAQEGEVIDLVGSEKLKAKLGDMDTVITDGFKNLAIAGVKGGLDSGVTNETKDILIEVANFDAVSVRKTARRLSIQTDASKRYENDLSPSLCDFAMKEITSLIFEICSGALFEESVDVYNKKPEVKKFSFNGEYISKILGILIPDQDIEKILKNYKYEYVKNGNSFEIIVPDARIDINGPHDMVEEIGRVYGYDKIIPKIPEIKTNHKDNPIWLKISRIKNKFIKDGYREVMTSVFTDKGDLEILASASDKNFLRNNIKDGLSKAYEFNRLNLPLLKNPEIKIFEIGAIFTKNGEFINIAFSSKKQIIEMSIDEFYSKELTDDSLSLCDFEIKLSQNSFKMWSIYPFIYRDIAVWVPSGDLTSKDKLLSIYKDIGGSFLNGEPVIFDEFTKGDRTSVAYRLIFQSYEKTLTDEEINPIMDKINNKIAELGWEVR